MRLDHFIAKRLGVSELTARKKIVAGAVEVNGTLSRDPRAEISRFTTVQVDGNLIQEGIPAIYLMLNKPVGVVSATKDAEHQTVLDLIDHPAKETLHLAGRLDRSSSGLILLTNDGKWSNQLTLPDEKVDKVYHVETETDIPAEAVERFQQGFYFATEDLVTRPAKLEILGPKQARVTLAEGRYHQIKRMFYRLDETRLVSLHRERIGPYALPDDLGFGGWREIPRIF